MADTVLSREAVANEALNILTALRENARTGKSNKLADVKTIFEKAVSLEFDTYFFFLRKYHFIGMDREACLQLTTDGERVLEGDKRERFNQVVGEYFANRFDGAGGASDGAAALDQSLAALPPAADAGGEGEEKGRPLSVPGVGVRPSDRVGRAARALRDEPSPRATREVPVSPTSSALPASPAAAAQGQEIDLRYVKYDAIGQGPLGTVYRGRHTALGLDIAVKELKDIFAYFSFLQRGEVIKRLKREICAQALVRHPGVLAVLDQNCDVARPFFVLELCAGGNLRARLEAANGKGLAPEEAIRFFLQILYGLRAAHQQGLTHGNLKPENVLIDHLGNAKLADFGLSRVIEVDTSKGMPQIVVGTGGVSYMSPEALARKDSGNSADVYSVGIMLYEMLTGQLPGRRSPLPSAVNSKVPAKLDAIFDKMTQDRREERYPDVESVLEDFYAAFDDGSWLKRGDLILTSDGKIAPSEG